MLSSGTIDEAHRALDARREELPSVDESLAYIAFEVALAEGDTAAMRAALAHASEVANPMYPARAALVPYLQGNQTAVQEISRSFADSTGYKPHVVQSYVALIEDRFEPSLNHWREGIRAGEPYAILFMISRYSWRKTFPEFYEYPDYQQMLTDFGLDPESRAKITVPELPF